MVSHWRFPCRLHYLLLLERLGHSVLFSSIFLGAPPMIAEAMSSCLESPLFALVPLSSSILNLFWQSFWETMKCAVFWSVLNCRENVASQVKVPAVRLRLRELRKLEGVAPLEGGRCQLCGGHVGHRRWAADAPVQVDIADNGRQPFHFTEFIHWRGVALLCALLRWRARIADSISRPLRGDILRWIGIAVIDRNICSGILQTVWASRRTVLVAERACYRCFYGRRTVSAALLWAAEIFDMSIWKHADAVCLGFRGLAEININERVFSNSTGCGFERGWGSACVLGLKVAVHCWTTV